MSQFDEMVEFLDLAYSNKDQIVPCLIGPVGIGKTAAVMQHAENVGANNVVKIIVSQILPNEVSGITMPNDETRSMDIYDHYRLANMKDGDILFFDELLEADQSVLKACLTLIESRELMSGKKLPDIQIIAATNPTIQPISLAENIRQRFMFRKFSLDVDQVLNYIKKKTKVDISSLRSFIETESDYYNILSPRSLTKLVEWGLKIDSSLLDNWAYQVNDMFSGSLIGSEIVKAIKNLNNSVEKQVRDEISRQAFNYLSEEDLAKLDWMNSSFSEIEKFLNDYNVWEYIKDQLANIQVEENDLVI